MSQKETLLVISWGPVAYHTIDVVSVVGKHSRHSVQNHCCILDDVDRLNSFSYHSCYKDIILILKGGGYLFVYIYMYLFIYFCFDTLTKSRPALTSLCLAYLIVFLVENQLTSRSCRWFCGEKETDLSPKDGKIYTPCCWWNGLACCCVEEIHNTCPIGKMGKEVVIILDRYIPEKENVDCYSP